MIRTCLLIFLALGATVGCGDDDAATDCGAAWSSDVPGTAEVVSVVVGDDGSVVLAGSVDGLDADFGDAVWRPDSLGGFLVAYDAEGALRFRSAIDGAAAQRVHEAGADGSNGYVVGGEFVRTLDAGGTPLTGVGGADAFVAHFDSDGAPLWVRGFGTTGTDTVESVHVVDGDFIAVTGRLGGSMDLGGVTVDPLGTSGTAWFVAELSLADGAAAWATAFAGPSAARVRGTADGVTVGGTTDVALTDFGEGIVPGIPGRSAGFAARFRRGGAVAWTRLFNGVAVTDAVEANVLSDANGRSAIAGVIRGDAGEVDGTLLDVPEGQSELYFLLGLDAAGEQSFLRINEVRFAEGTDDARVVVTGPRRLGTRLGDSTIERAGPGNFFALYEPDAARWGPFRILEGNPPTVFASRGDTFVAFTASGMINEPSRLVHVENAPSSLDRSLEDQCGF